MREYRAREGDDEHHPYTKTPAWRRAPDMELAGSTGLEPAASGVTGRRSNPLNYDPEREDLRTGPQRAAWLSLRRRLASEGWWAVQDSNL